MADDTGLRQMLIWTGIALLFALLVAALGVSVVVRLFGGS